MPIDEWIVRWLPTPGASGPFDAAMILASTAGLVVPVVGIPWWLSRRDRSLARATLIALVAGFTSTLLLQWLSLRPRPSVSLPLLPVPPLPSFPSGHAVLVTVVMVALMAHRPRRPLEWLGWSSLGLVVALSRVHVGHHHASDVLGGVVLGLGIGLGAIAYARADAGDRFRHRWMLWPQLGLVLAVSLVAYTGTFARGEVWWLRVPGMDKALHFLMFGLLALGVHLHCRGRRLELWRWRLPLAVVVPLLGASLEEIVQATSPHRTADLVDLLADLLGLLTFWWWGEVLCRVPETREFTPAPRRPSRRRGSSP